MPTSATKFLDPQVLQRISRVAGGAILAKTLVIVNATDYGKCDQAGANGQCIGISDNGHAAGEDVSVMCRGHLPLVAGGTVAKGDEIVADAAGKGVVRGTTATTLYNVIGRALTGAAAGEIFMVDFGNYTVWGANAS